MILEPTNFTVSPSIVMGAMWCMVQRRVPWDGLKLMLASVLGGLVWRTIAAASGANSAHIKSTCAAAAAAAAAVCCVCTVYASGFAVCGFGMGEHFASRPKLLAAALQHLPADKPRVVVGLVSSCCSHSGCLQAKPWPPRPVGPSTCLHHLQQGSVHACRRLHLRATWLLARAT